MLNLKTKERTQCYIFSTKTQAMNNHNFPIFISELVTIFYENDNVYRQNIS